METAATTPATTTPATTPASAGQPAQPAPPPVTTPPVTTTPPPAPQQPAALTPEERLRALETRQVDLSLRQELATAGIIAPAATDLAINQITRQYGSNIRVNQFSGNVEVIAPNGQPSNLGQVVRAFADSDHGKLLRAPVTTPAGTPIVGAAPSAAPQTFDMGTVVNSMIGKSSAEIVAEINKYKK